jgi:hypothetical protein
MDDTWSLLLGRKASHSFCKYVWISIFAPVLVRSLGSLSASIAMREALKFESFWDVLEISLDQHRLYSMKPKIV